MAAVTVDDSFHVKLFSRAPIYDLVFASLSPRSLFRVALTCRTVYLAVAAFKSRAFNINRHLSRFFSDPIAFRSLQAKTSTLVSGSNALQFLDRTFYPEADLDLYTHPGHSFEVAQFLVETGYHYAPRSSQEKDWKEAIEGNWDGTERRVVSGPGADHAYPMTGVTAVWTFEKKGINEDQLKVQVIEASSSPLESILGFHSTCVMNFISSDAAYSLYPIATFEKRCTLGMSSARSLSRCSPKVIQKYVKRGWRFYFVPTPGDMGRSKRTPFFLEQARWVWDKHTWILPLDRTGVKERPPLSPASVPLHSDPVLYNGWSFRREPDDGYECHYYPLRTTLFRYNYMIPNERLAYTMRDWARQQGLYSHGRVSKEDWVWFDADIPNSFMMETREHNRIYD